MTIAVTGCRRTLPSEFPLELSENAGNMIHANAPFEMFSDTMNYADGDWRESGARSFAEYVSQHCSHLIITMANSFRSNEQDGTRYSRFISMIEQYDKPIVVFGLGIQAPTTNLDDIALHPEAVRMMRVLGERCAVVGVRGETTAAAFRKFAGVENTFVTGCPSLYSRPEGIERLALRGPADAATGRFAYSPTKLTSEIELDLFHQNIRAGSFHIEAGNPKHHRFHLAAAQSQKAPAIPQHLKPLLEGELAITRRRLERHFRKKYRLFRDPHKWYAFNARRVDFTYGTRFHVNMASLLSGVPAMWLTHDARTEELTNFLRLPAMNVAEAAKLTPAEVRDRTDYSDFLNHVPSLFANFNEYLGLNGLPSIPAPRV